MGQLICIGVRSDFEQMQRVLRGGSDTCMLEAPPHTIVEHIMELNVRHEQDFICRYGGEEFLIGLPHTDAEQAYAIMDRIRRDFAQIRHPHRDSHFVSTASGGIATYPLHRTGDALIKSADEALYQAKRGGRNRIHAVAG